MSSLTFGDSILDIAGIINLIQRMAVILLCLTVHETAHGFAAYLLGDPTAKREHRLSLNPLRHIDPLGALMMLTVGFGWAKPVPVDMRYFKHPKRGMAITALAGPVSNFILAFVAILVALFMESAMGYNNVPKGLITLLIDIALLSIGLGVFNLIPFPPLDGSKVMEAILPDRIYYQILRYERYGVILLMFALWMGLMDGPLSWLRNYVVAGLLYVAGGIVGLFF